MGVTKLRRARVSLGLILMTIALGLAVRYGWLGLPPVVEKYGGSVLWALMVYWIVSTLLPRWRLWRAGLVAVGVTTAVEVFKLYDPPQLDAFRRTVVGALLLGRVFSVADLVAYWSAIVVGVGIDGWIRRSGLNR